MGAILVHSANTALKFNLSVFEYNSSRNTCNYKTVNIIISPMKLLSIVFSFRNEEKNLEELVNRISSALKKINDWKYEIIFVNDDSTDTSEKILTNLQKTANIKIINMSRRFGRSPCVLAGLNEASGDAADFIWIQIYKIHQN